MNNTSLCKHHEFRHMRTYFKPKFTQPEEFELFYCIKCLKIVHKKLRVKNIRW